VLNAHRRQLTRAQLDDVLSASDVDPGLIVSWEELTEGTYNTAYRVVLSDGRRLVLKVAPDWKADVLSYEHGIMATEELFYRRAQRQPVPVPRVVGSGSRHDPLEIDFLLMTECPGRVWIGARDLIGDADRLPLRRELGRIVGRLHQVTGSGFGYPQQPLLPTWRAAFLGMVDAVLGDAARYATVLPGPAADIAAAVRAAAYVLDEVSTPVLIHYDLWDGNILVTWDGGRPTIGGLIDGERAFWGDPVAEFVSLALFDDIERDEAFLAGYRDAGGSVVFDAGTRARLALYRTYLYLIMLVEAGPRGYAGPGHERRSRVVGDHLLGQLDTLARAGSRLR
jgi:Ser/Thr protein kinase RdoA (MazF antagonist)